MLTRLNRSVPRSKRELVPEAVADVIIAGTRPCGLEDVPQAPCFVETGLFTALNFGRKHENEDRGISASDECPLRHGATGFHMVSIMDGHDSEKASDLVSKLLHVRLGKLLKTGMGVVEAYIAAMAEVEEDLKRHHVETSGTCVCSCLTAGRFVWCANLGDCRGALFHLEVPTSSAATSPKVVGIDWLSVDQKASATAEMQRIVKAGGMVEGGRVQGLEPSRTLGDFDVKLSQRKGVISIVPEVRRVELGDGASMAQAIIVCATDGVWDAITGQDICNFINMGTSRKEIVKLQQLFANLGVEGPEAAGRSGRYGSDCVSHCADGPMMDLAEDVVRFAVGRGSRDDCTAIVAMVSVPAHA